MLLRPADQERGPSVHRDEPDLTKLRCSPSRTTAMVQAILVLHHVENPTYQGGKTLSHADRPS